MKTLTSTIQQNPEFPMTTGRNIVSVIAASLKEIVALLAAVTTATAIVLLSIWIAGQEINEILGAGIWGVGFIFLGVAVDKRDPGAFLLLATGLALLVLAWLQSSVSTDYAIVSGVLIAGWVAVSTFKRLR